IVERHLYLTAGAQLRVAADPTGATPLGIVTQPVPDMGPAPEPQPAPAVRMDMRVPAPVERPLTGRWWFWAGVAVVVAGGVVATAAATGAFSHPAGCPSGFTSCK